MPSSAVPSSPVRGEEEEEQKEEQEVSPGRQEEQQVLLSSPVKVKQQNKGFSLLLADV